MSGAVQKKGDLGGAWATRWAELRGPVLTYWGGPDKKVKKGDFHLGGCSVRKDMGGERPVFVIISTNQHQHIHSFRLLPGETEASSVFEQWVKALKEAAATHEKQIVDGVVSISHLHDIAEQEDAKQGGSFPPGMLTWCLVFRVDHGAHGEIPVEALEVARNLAAAHLHVEDRLSKDHARLFLLVGAREDLMINEATKYCTIDMRLKDIQGTHRFHRDLHEGGYYAPPMYGDGRSAFTSAQRQVLTKSIIYRLAGEDLDDRVHTPNRSKDLRRLQKGVKGMQPQKTWKVENVLDMYGASRRTAAEDMPKCSELLQEVRGDLTGVIDPVQHRWELLEEAIMEMERYDEEGMAHFTGHMLSFFPLHCDEELVPLIEKWSTFAVFKTLFVNEKSLIASNVPYYRLEPSRQIACLYQPLDEIRDYFGEPTAMYFAFAGLYCQSMLYPALLSIFVEVLHRLRVYPQWVLDLQDLSLDNSANSNLYVLPYSVFLAIWAIMLLESWKRREWELKFIWGSEGFEKDEQPRPEFDGVPEENLLTGVVTLVYGNIKGRMCKLALSLSLTVTLMALNIVLLFQAIGLSGKQSMQEQKAQLVGENGTAFGNSTWVIVERTGIEYIDKNFYELLAAVLNLFIIVVFGGLYQSLAEKLTDWENHRTQTEWDDALTVKSFLFQFVNNYFTLFYIALFRQFRNPFGPAQPCQESSCLDDLTQQLAIIFCGKVFTAKMADLARPFIKRYIGLHLAKLKLKMQLKQMDQIRALLLMDDGEELEARRQAELEQFQRSRYEEDEGLEITDPFELQERKPPAESLFDNFSDLSIEFGYLSFFSPAFPLACLLAFFANLIDLRSDSIAITRGTRRVDWKHAEDIGSWYQVLSTISFIAVITNACILGFVSTQMSSKGTVEEENIENRFRSYTIWIGVIGFEHAVVVLKIIVSVVMPDQPRWIDSAKDQLTYYRKNKLLTRKQQNDKKALREELSATKQLAHQSNVRLTSVPTKNDKLDPSKQAGTLTLVGKTRNLNVLFKGKQKKDPTAPENRFGGGRVGKIGGSSTLNPMQDMVSCAYVAAPFRVFGETAVAAATLTASTCLVRAGACDYGQRRRFRCRRLARSPCAGTGCTRPVVLQCTSVKPCYFVQPTLPHDFTLVPT